MTHELEENRTSIRRMETRIRDIEEAVKLLAQEQRHARELESAERERLLLRVLNELAKLKELPAPRGRKGT
jgi:archaellum component FlaC